MSTPTPGVYAKGQDVRVADTASEAVSLKFAGYVKRESDVTAPAPVDEVPATNPAAPDLSYVSGLGSGEEEHDATEGDGALEDLDEDFFDDDDDDRNA